MKKQVAFRTHRRRYPHLGPAIALMLGASTLPVIGFAATSNVDIYGIIHFSLEHTLIESGATGAQAGLGLANLAMFGAHHRSLLDMGITPGEKETCAWATADAATQSSANFSEGLAEAGVCKDVGSMRWGVGLGQAWSRQDRLFGGKTTFDGQYLIAEVANDFRNGLQASFTAYYGRFDARLRRNYLNGGVDSSSGRSDAESVSARVRLDWKDAGTLGAFSLSPYAAYSWSETELDAYTETGGGLPEQFNASSWHVSDVRLGAAAAKALSPSTDLRLSLTVAHRFESSTGSVSGPSFNFLARFHEQTRGIATVDVDHRLSRSTALTFGALVSGLERDDWGGGITAGLRTSF